MVTQAFTGTLNVVDCPSCGVAFGITAEYEQRRREDRQSFYCPAGHSMSYGETAREKELRQAKADRDWYEKHYAEQYRMAEAAKRSAAAARGVVTRMKRRVSKGVCPCCNRTFKDLAAHMEGQHPDWSNGDG